jgi:uncharacterized membrane protein YtjA (UPF0391 family)
MLSWPLAFLIIALLAALPGFTEIAGTAALLTEVIFALFLALLLASMTCSQKQTSDDEHLEKEPK